MLALPLLLWAGAAHPQPKPPLYDPTSLNIGLNCQWQQRCIKDQQRAMKRALKFVRKGQAPLWRVQLCNRNAGRQRFRVDWVGFDNCIRNSVLRPLPARAIKVPARAVRVPARAARKPARRISEGAPPPSTFGERG